MNQQPKTSPDDVSFQKLSLNSPVSDSQKESQLTFRSPRSSTAYTSTINADIQAKLLAFQEQRQSKPSSNVSIPLTDRPESMSPFALNDQKLSPTSEESAPLLRVPILSPSSSSSSSSSHTPVAAPVAVQTTTASSQVPDTTSSPQEILHQIELQRKKSFKSASLKEKPLPPLPPTLPRQQQQQETDPTLQPPPMGLTNSERFNPIRPAPSLPINSQVSPQVAARLPKQKQSLSQRRGMKLPGGLPGSEQQLQQKTQQSSSNVPSIGNSSIMARRLASKTNQQSTMTTSANASLTGEVARSNLPGISTPKQLKGLFANYSEYIDIKSGSLNFGDKLSLDQNGVNFKCGQNFSISAKDLEFIEELGRGNYGTVTKVLHKPSQVIMAMKEVRLELDDSKFRQILMELQVLHNCDSPYIVDFFGAFFVEGAVYMCMEYMDAGSLDKIYGNGIDEPRLQYITKSVILGLKELKEKHNIIHRDVKPTNILVNTQGKVKLCDFGVSGNLVASLAKTNIGCQSYMAPERIKSMNPDDVRYSVQSDVWSLGLTILETAKGSYPYPPETYDNIFSQLNAIVEGLPPRLPDSYSAEAIDFVSRCLDKIPDRRPTYSNLLTHPWLQFDESTIDMGGFIKQRLEDYSKTKGEKHTKDYEELNQKLKTPALHKGGVPKGA